MRVGGRTEDSFSERGLLLIFDTVFIFLDMGSVMTTEETVLLSADGAWCVR